MSSKQTRNHWTRTPAYDLRTLQLSNKETEDYTFTRIELHVNILLYKLKAVLAITRSLKQTNASHCIPSMSKHLKTTVPHLTTQKEVMLHSQLLWYRFQRTLFEVSTKYVHAQECGENVENIKQLTSLVKI